MEQSKNEPTPFHIAPIELKPEKYWDFYEMLLVINTKLYRSEKITEKEFIDFFNCIYYDNNEIAWHYLNSLSFFKDRTLKENIGFINSEKLYRLISTHRTLKAQFPEFDSFYNSKLNVFFYIFFNIYGILTRIFTQPSNHGFGMLALMIKKNLVMFENENNIEKQNKNDYQSFVLQIRDDIIKISIKKPNEIEKYSEKNLSDYSIDDLKQLGGCFIPFKDNIRRIVKYLELRISHLIDVKQNSRDVLNGFICSLIDVVDSEEDYEKKYTDYANRRAEKKHRGSFANTYKEYLVKYEIKKFRELEDKYMHNFSSWLK